MLLIKQCSFQCCVFAGYICKELQIKRHFLFRNKNIRCDTSLEPSQEDGSNIGSQCMF